MHWKTKYLGQLPGIVFLVLALVSCRTISGPESDARPVNHAEWDTLVRLHVSDDGYVDYPGFRKDSAKLNTYLEKIAANWPNDSHWTEAEQLAYWINAYNAFTVQIVIRHLPVQSIKDIGGKVPFVNTVWDVKFIDIQGKKLDLNNLEHNIIRKKFVDPRVHFALVCAAYSCPKLRNEAYTAEKLDAQLEDQARDFLNDPRKNTVEAETLKLSKIFNWYEGDFKASGAADLRQYVNRFANTPAAEGVEIEWLEYDWSLNGNSGENPAHP